MNTQSESASYWVDIICNSLDKAYPKEELIVSSGISPSGPYSIRSLKTLRRVSCESDEKASRALNSSIFLE